MVFLQAQRTADHHAALDVEHILQYSLSRYSIAGTCLWACGGDARDNSHVTNQSGVSDADGSADREWTAQR